MNSDEVTLILNIVQTLIIAFSFVALIWQLRQFNRNLRHDALSKEAGYFVRMNELLLEKPKIADLLYPIDSDYGKLSEDEKGLYTFLSLIFAYFEHAFILWQEKILTPHQWAAWERWLDLQVFTLRHFQVFWENERLVYDERFSQYIDGRYMIYKNRSDSSAS